MLKKLIYVCEYCGKEYKHSIDAYKCEANCLGMDFENYKLMLSWKNNFEQKCSMFHMRQKQNNI